jgi:TolA-binding protein
MSARRSVAALALLVSASCVASKGDIRLLQDELRATRSQVALGDSSILRADEARRAQIAQLSTKLDRAIDSLRFVANRLSTLSASSSGNFDQLQQQVSQMSALLNQTTRNLQDTRTQVQMLNERAVPAAPDPSMSASPISPTTGAPAPGVPGAATLYASASESINQGAYATGRRSLEQLLASYPTYEMAPRAMLRIGETYQAERNAAAADSVYRIVSEKYAGKPEAGLALYRVGKALWDAGNRNDARPILLRVTREYPNSDAATLAKETMTPRE